MTPATPDSAHHRLLVRTDSAGATSALLGQLHARGLRFSVGLPIDAHIRDAVLSLSEDAWSPAIDADGQRRDGACAAEVTGWLDLAATRRAPGHLPPGTAHPGARPRFTEAYGCRYQVMLTDQPDRCLPGWSFATASTPASRSPG
jgi:hypothetical protein